MQMPKPKIIFSDRWILVINKPSGLVVNRAETVKGKTLQDWVEENNQISKSVNNRIIEDRDFVSRSGVVHRLDKDTSGIMVVAKTPQAFTELQRQFKDRQVIKKYLALAHGRLKPKKGDIKLPLARNPQNRKKFVVRLKGKMALTYYQVLNYWQKGEWFSFLELKPKTGRTHQLRVHLSHLGHPIVADPIYLGRKRLIGDRQWCSRLFLHAQFLSFIHPQCGQRVQFSLDLPEELRKIMPQDERR